MRTKQIQQLICVNEVLKGNIPCENVNYLLRGEQDVLSILKSGYLSEYEVKISRSDFKADFKKDKWKSLRLRIESHIPNYFSFVCPSELIQLDEIPPFCGLIYAKDKNLTVIRKPKILHRTKRNTEKILTKFCRVKSERQYLGSCLLTYKNNLLKNHP